ncbi:helicase-related protein [Asticcacaulis taihuensis]|uniref:Helicase conserved C-terminal domain-containing protein n=1 Tax=Asticcacaulis taihuensis TaxID=260084 RepID=A0A1G4SPW1_9CAUL|nr:helicase-related protein [Asticcacaulis taihuensis]SCW71242.1 Helicase conserved C-terminal domain-containing protein [Asticcacaulis taihuensis]
MSEPVEEEAPGIFASKTSFRSMLAQTLRRQVFGPTEEDGDAELKELLTVSPLQLYATGVLFPQRMVQEFLESSEELQPGEISEGVSGDLLDIGINEIKGNTGRLSEDEDHSTEREPLNMANEFSPSACGISFRVAELRSLKISITFGTYSATTIKDEHPRAGKLNADGSAIPETREIPAYQRRHHSIEIAVNLMGKSGALEPLEIDSSNGGLKLYLTVRRRSDNTAVISAMVVNCRTSPAGAACTNDMAYFQVALAVVEEIGAAIFLPIDRDAGDVDDDELRSLELLYRHRRAFALGHGVAGDWNVDETMSLNGRTNMVRTAAVPSYELKPILPREKGFEHEDLQLSMSFFFDANGHSRAEEEIITALNRLATDYENWIKITISSASKLEPHFQTAAEKNINKCKICLSRIKAGIDVLKTNASAMLAFRLMNKAMLIQQFHSSSITFREVGTPYPDIPKDYKNLPRERKWRPFQLAFILMNIASMSSYTEPERGLVDLIWFPTGGGKTEAYLGLAAFTICIERMRGAIPGVTVLMRYTLRLLTAQQFQRASALVLALELLRRNEELGANLGDVEISIGLWVGQGLSPNKRTDATAALTRLQNDRHAQNPFQVLQCPWCGVDFRSKPSGYQSFRSLNSNERTVRFICPDDACAFGKESGGLPILVIDDDLYDNPPTILIGTVDKFAQIAWDDRVGRLFGIGNGAPPPALVIQDELHLISGPLGTIVGLYETAIDRLCQRDGHIHKIVASTATIRRAEEQCRNLYARESFEFPPQAIRAGESYFAREDNESSGRLYVGFMGTAVKSHQTALVRACSPLLQAVCVPTGDDERKNSIVDPYGTMVWYFNSLRELGHAATLCMGDIPEFLKGLRHRLRIPFDQSRYLREIPELTSRLNAEEIPGILQQLAIPWRMRAQGNPVDILLATNMIAVGMDVPRLGLIVMSGQPKSTSEYIQATSRVGRSHPGLVLTVYTQTKSRDRSHYERFMAYHQSLYRHVEPTSVTPFSPQSRDRGMRGVLIALARQLAGVAHPNQLRDRQQEVENEVAAILDRVSSIDEGEAIETDDELSDWLEDWRRYSPPEYGRMAGKVEESTLAYPFGGYQDPAFQREAWPVMTSMRNVDGTSEARVLNIYSMAGMPQGEQ